MSVATCPNFHWLFWFVQGENTVSLDTEWRDPLLTSKRIGYYCQVSTCFGQTEVATLVDIQPSRQTDATLCPFPCISWWVVSDVSISLSLLSCASRKVICVYLLGLVMASEYQGSIWQAAAVTKGVKVCWHLLLLWCNYVCVCAGAALHYTPTPGWLTWSLMSAWAKGDYSSENICPFLGFTPVRFKALFIPRDLVFPRWSLKPSTCLQ